MKGLITLILCLLNHQLVFGSEGDDEKKINWDKEYKKLCEYESYHYCRKIKNYSGWTKPAPNIVEALKVMRPRIKETAEELGVDPRIIVGAILTENSINVGIEDTVQDWLVEVGLADDGKIFGKQFSFGWGQLYIEAARDADKVLAKLEKRDVYSDKEITKRLQTPHLAMRYAAALSKFNIDSYVDCACNSKENPERTCGFDISDKPWIAVTLYNIGKPKYRCQRSIRNKRNPRMNFFGLWAGKNEDVIAQILGPKDQVIDFEMKKNDGLLADLVGQEAIEQVSEKFGIQAQLDYSLSRDDYDELNRIKVIEKLKTPYLLDGLFFDPTNIENFEVHEQKQRSENTQTPFKISDISNDSYQNLNRQLELINILSDASGKGLKVAESMDLTHIPTGCLNSKRDLSKIKTVSIPKNDEVVSILDERTCKNDRYILLVTSSGKRGWVLKSEVINKTTIGSEVKKSCNYQYDTKCRERIKYYTGITLNEDDSIGALTYELNEINGGDYKSDSCKNFDWNESFQEDLQKALGIISYCNVLGKPNSKEAEEELQKISEKLQSFRYLDFEDIKDNLSSLYAICRVRSVDADPKQRGLSKVSLEFLLCNPQDDPFEANKKIVDFHKEVAILMTYMDSQKTEENYFLKELKGLSNSLDTLKESYKDKKCYSLYRDKTKEFLSKIIDQDCIKEIEVPNLDIAADYFDNPKFVYIPSESKKVLFRTKKLSCKEQQ